MPYVKSSVPYDQFISGRDTDSSVHREDGLPGECCGHIVDDDVRATDTVITESEYQTLVAEIKLVNDDLPALVYPTDRLQTLQDMMIEGTITPDETQEMLRWQFGVQEQYVIRQAEIEAGR